MDEAELERFRSILNERQSELQETTAKSQDARKPVELDQASVGRLSRMDAMQVQAMAQASERRRKAELGRIRKAFERMDEDEFGFCLECGGEIAVKRLEIDPAASLCVTCAGKAD